MKNIIEKCNNALLDKAFRDGLYFFTQSNCQVTLTDIGYRIYRPPNVNPTDNGNTMWGGLVIKPFNADSNALEKNHTYIIKFEVMGKTSNAVSDVNWNNQAGWNGGGLTPTPTTIAKTEIEANWQSDNWFPFQWIFSIPDDIYKVCTKSYSSFVQGTTYLSYRDFKFGFGYTNTGSMGTDLYIRNLRMYDITTKPNTINFNKNGIINSSNFVENIGNTSIKIDGDLYSNEFIEI